jgi:uncharacterized integral membrane protein
MENMVLKFRKIYIQVIISNFMSKKNNHQTIHLVAATIFGIVTLVHALRIGYNSQLVLGSWQSPLWISWLAVFITGSLAVLLWKSAND